MKAAILIALDIPRTQRISVPDPKRPYTGLPLQIQGGSMEWIGIPSFEAGRVNEMEHDSFFSVLAMASLNEVRFADGTQVNSHATEVLIRHGAAVSTGGQIHAGLVADVVDMEGGISSGEIVRGDNPVCVTFKLVIEAVDG